MDQSPLPFVLDDDKNHDKIRDEEVWIASDQSDTEKR